MPPRTVMEARSTSPSGGSSRRRVLGGAIGVLLIASTSLVVMSRHPMDVGNDEPRWVATGRYYFSKLFVEHDLSIETWSDPAFRRFGTRNPPIGKYLFGLAQVVSGTGSELTDRDTVLTLWRRKVQRVDRRALDAVRVSVSVTAAAAVVLLYALAVSITGAVSIAIVAAVLLLHDGIVSANAQLAMTDVPALAFALLWLWLTVAAAPAVRDGTRARAVGAGAMLGAAAALAAGTKLNALVTAPVSVGWGLVLIAWPSGKPRVPGAAGRLALATVGAIVTGALLWVAANPFLYPAPLSNTGTLLSYGSELRAAAAQPNPLEVFLGAIDTPRERWMAMLRFAREGPVLALAGARYIDAGLILAGAAFAVAALTGRFGERQRRGAALLSIWIVVNVAALLAWTPFAWGRYYLPIEPCWAILEAVGLIGVIGIGARQLRRLAPASE